MAVALHVVSDDGAVEDVEGGEQRGCAVTFVVMRHGAGAARLLRQSLLGAIERLNLRSHGDLWVKMFGSRFHGKSPVVARVSKV